MAARKKINASEMKGANQRKPASAGMAKKHNGAWRNQRHQLAGESWRSVKLSKLMAKSLAIMAQIKSALS